MLSSVSASTAVGTGDGGRRHSPENGDALRAGVTPETSFVVGACAGLEVSIDEENACVLACALHGRLSF